MPAIRMREKFPFLTKSDCPPELKILWADMLATHDEYIKHRDLLFQENDSVSVLEHSSGTVENYLENKSIWAEFNFYRENGRVLGKHPIFSFYKRINQIRGMTLGDIVRLKIRLENNMVKNKKLIRSQPGHGQTANRMERVEKMKNELMEVNRLLNL
ncbi:MAG: hypothetical protein ABSE72_07255 [Bacteroidales bacterium]